MNGFNRLFATRAPAATLLVRLMVGAVFLSEGIQKFLFPAALGVGRLAKIGFPSPETLALFVGGVEIIGGAFLILGLLTRLAAFALLINISVAIVSTKVPILLGQGLWGFSLPKMAHYGFWPMAHEARTDFCMLLGSLFLLVVGAGVRSLDARIANGRAS